MTFKEYLLFPLKLFFVGCFHPIYKKNLAKIIASLCPDNSYVLDFGCDDGSTAEKIIKFNPSLKIVGVDIQSNRPAKIPIKLFDGNKIPYPDNTFDVVISLDVLHHTNDISKHIKEMKRVSKKYLIIKKHMTHGFFSRLLISFTDYVSNLPFGIKCAFNFPSKYRWYKIFEEENLEIIENCKKLHFGFGINERYNPVFKLQKYEKRS